MMANPILLQKKYSRVIDGIRHIAAAKAKAVAKTAKQRRDDDDDEQYREPAHAGALIVVHSAFSFPRKLFQRLFQPGEFC